MMKHFLTLLSCLCAVVFCVWGSVAYAASASNYNTTATPKLIDASNKAAIEKAFGTSDFSKMSSDQIKAVQKSLGVAQDGMVGPDTINAAIQAATTVNQPTKASGDAGTKPGAQATKDPCEGKTDPSDFRCASFTFDPNTFSPASGEGYYGGTQEGASGGNTVKLLRKIAQFLLVVVSTGAVLFITVGGFLMAISAGDSDRSTKGRTIITYNVQALVIALLSYGIIQFVIWLI